MTGVRVLSAALLCALSLAFAAAAGAADHQGVLSAESPTFKWSGGPLFGAIVAGPVENTLLDVQSPGTLTVTTTGTSPGDPIGDIDIYLYAADANGEPAGDPVASSAQGGSDESLSLHVDQPAKYIVQAFAFTGTAATYDATATLTADTPAAEPPTDAPPTVRRTAPKARVKAASLTAIRGTARDDKGIKRVEVAIVRLKGAKCSILTSKGAFRASRSCTPTRYFKASGTKRWTFTLKQPLPKGVYAIYVRAVDSAGQVSQEDKRPVQVT